MTSEDQEKVAKAAMFFAGLILLIPHRIGMSRVNYVVKRYHLPISRAGLLLYKFHNPIEVSLTIGTLLGNIIVWYGGGLFPGTPTYGKPCKMWYISIFMIAFLFLMLLSSIYMFIVYILGSDYGHLNSFYFSLILITLFDGFTNAFAFGLNAKEGASLLSAGIPISGLLVSLLHIIYKFISDKYHWNNFDYYVLRLQLILNIITLLANIGLWSYDLYNKYTSENPVKVGKIQELFGTGNDHTKDWVPIALLAISLGTVYAFYPSIAPYSIIDFQYASVIELWILFISALIPIALAILDTIPIAGAGGEYKYGPSGCLVELELIAKITVHTSNKYLNFSGQQFNLNTIQVKHPPVANNNNYHGTTSIPGTCGQSANPDTQLHTWKNNGELTNVTLSEGDIYKDSQGNEITVPKLKDHDDITNKKPSKITYKYYFNWFQEDTNLKYNLKDNNDSGDLLKVTINGKGDSTTIDDSTYDGSVDVKKDSGGIVNNNIALSSDTTSYNAMWWNCVWFSAIFYILCIQIFMTLLHYPDCLLSCHCNNHPYFIVFISVLFNTVREVMQACAFAGAGKQCNNKSFNDIKDYISTHLSLPANLSDFQDKLREKLIGYKFDNTKKVRWKETGNPPTYSAGDIKLKHKPNELTGEDTSHNNYIEMKTSTTTNIIIPSLYKWDGSPYSIPYDGKLILYPNGNIDATNKLITLFVMMFCVFTGDGYLQHYRRCCRDCWSTTGFNEY